MPYRIELRPAALRDLTRLDVGIRRKIVAEIEKLGEVPRPPGCRQLETPGRLYRVSAGPGKRYRIIYEIHDKVLVVLVLALGDRKDVDRRLGLL